MIKREVVLAANDLLNFDFHDFFHQFQADITKLDASAKVAVFFAHFHVPFCDFPVRWGQRIQVLSTKLLHVLLK
jgi:hypothetical protein